MVHYTEMTNDSKEGLLKESLRNLRLRDEMITELEKMFRRYAEAKADLMLRTTNEEELLRINKLYTKMISKTLKDVTNADERRAAEAEEQRQEYYQSCNRTKELLHEQTEIRDGLRLELAQKLQQLEDQEEEMLKKSVRQKQFATQSSRSSDSQQQVEEEVITDDVVNYNSVRTVSDWVTKLRTTQPSAPPTTVGALLRGTNNSVDGIHNQTADDEMIDAFTQLQSIKSLINVSEEAKSSLKRGTSP